jgi:hypothetical protein
MTHDSPAPLDPRAAFHPGRWLLVGLTWEDLPERVRHNPWARLRQEAGLIEVCGERSWASALRGLLRQAPPFRVRVLACMPDGGADDELMPGVLPLRVSSGEAPRVSWHHLEGPPDAARADPLQGLRSLLGPEPESLNFRAANGGHLWPYPLGLPPPLTNRWQVLLAAWASQQLDMLHQSAETGDEAMADWVNYFSAPEPLPLVGDVGRHGEDVDAAGNDVVVALRADGASKLESFSLGFEGVSMRVAIPGRARPGEPGVGFPAWCVDVAVRVTPGLADVPQPVAAVDLHDGSGPAIVLAARDARAPDNAFFASWLVGSPDSGDHAGWLVWSLDSGAHAALEARVRRWRERGVHVVLRAAEP